MIMAKVIKGNPRYAVICKHAPQDEWCNHGPRVYYIVDKATGWRTQQEWWSPAEAHDAVIKLLKQGRKK